MRSWFGQNKYYLFQNSSRYNQFTSYSWRTIMNKVVENYGLKAVKRPKIKATKQLDLSGDAGHQIIKSETKLVLRTHPKTFKKLADM